MEKKKTSLIESIKKGALNASAIAVMGLTAIGCGDGGSNPASNDNGNNNNNGYGCSTLSNGMTYCTSFKDDGQVCNRVTDQNGNVVEDYCYYR